MADREHPRPEWFRLRLTFLEKKQLKKEAKEARLTMSDYVRKRLGLPLSYKQSINVLHKQNLVDIVAGQAVGRGDQDAIDPSAGDRIAQSVKTRALQDPGTYSGSIGVSIVSN